MIGNIFRYTIMVLLLPLVPIFGFFFATHRGKWWLAGYWEEYKPRRNRKIL